LNHFSKKEILDKHLEYCKNHAAVKIKMPKKGIDSSVSECENHKHSMRVPITVYTDFECFAKMIDTFQPNPEKSNTKQWQKHNPSGFCMYVICYGKELEPVLHTKQSDDKNIAQIFVEKVLKEIEKVWSSEIKPMIVTN